MLRRQPVAARLQRLAGQDLDAVAAGRLEIQRHDAAVDLGAAAAVADIGVHVVGEIEHGRAARQVHDLALRRQQIDAIFEHVGLEAGEQRGVVLVLVLGFEQLAHPGDLALEALVAAAAFLVAPVRCDAAFGVRVHLVRADLHLERLALRPDHRGVQRLVVVALGPRDVVVEFARHRRPQRVHDAERGVAGGHVVDQHAQRADVVQRGELAALALHLFPDRIDVLRPAGDFGVDSRLGQRTAQRSHRDRDEALAVRAALVERAWRCADRCPACR